jgi:Zn-dependent protease with chaperone function
MTPKIISYAQMGLSALFLVAYFTVVLVFLLGYVRTPPEWRDAAIALLGVITGGVGTVLTFWFSRSREHDRAE